ncbi:MAG TPA: TauD/TfdA family dioxygenase [Xenococcaceae cyanobacterium]
MDTIKYFLSNNQAPCVISPKGTSIQAPLTEIVSWLKAQRQFIEAELQSTGAILLRGFKAIRGAEAFETIISTLSPQTASDQGSTSPRTAVHNQIYTSTDAPAYLPIELHQERSFHWQFPDKIAFFCDVAPQKGGETPIADMRSVFKALSPELIQRFQAKGVRLRRRLPNVNFTSNKGIRTWQETFGTNERSEVENLAAKLKWELNWSRFYLEVDNCVRPPCLTHPVTGDRVWFNQAHVLHKSNLAYWAKQYNSFKLKSIAALAPIIEQFYYYHYTHGDNSEIAATDLAQIRQAVAQQKIEFSWAKGDVLLLDNILMAHGRNRFAGARKILVGLIQNESPTK